MYIHVSINVCVCVSVCALSSLVCCSLTQMAIQLAYYRIYKKFVLTYESATTRLIISQCMKVLYSHHFNTECFIKGAQKPFVLPLTSLASLQEYLMIPLSVMKKRRTY